MTSQAIMKVFEYASTLTLEEQEDFAKFLSFYLDQGQIGGMLMDRIIEEHREMLKK
jgi:hypothetical protein